MIPSVLTVGYLLPESFRFLNVGWWIVHLIAIPLVFLIGWFLARKKSHSSAGPSGSSQA